MRLTQMQAKKLPMVSDLRDESDRKGMRIVLELRRGAHVAVVLNTLYKHTNLRNSFSCNMIALVDGTPKMLTLKQALRHYIDFREEVVKAHAGRAAGGLCSTEKLVLLYADYGAVEVIGDSGVFVDKEDSLP